MATVKAECRSCGGTGLYCGFAEPKGVAVVCLGCRGTGCEAIEYKPFVRRNEKNGVKTVRLSQGSMLITGVGPDLMCDSITYARFKNGELPKTPRR